MSQQTITFTIPNEEYDIVSEYARTHDISVNDLYRNTVFDKIEDDLDLTELQDTIRYSIESNEVGITQDEMEQLLSK
ncbi:antitoxin [Aerococcaceae bacterium DSM 111022]|nr:antitoxin [Aerococcaceae bacterium DSM 111022]